MFAPHPLLAHPHLQTTVPHFLPRALDPAWRRAGRRRTFLLPDGDRLAGVWHPHPGDPGLTRPTLLLLHGLENDAETPYMQGLSAKAFALGWHSLRLNFRNCGGTEHLARRLYNGALTADVEAVRAALASEIRGPLAMAGASLGGSLLLKRLAEYGDAVPEGLAAAAAISPPLTLGDTGGSLRRGLGPLYEQYFLASLRWKLMRKARADEASRAQAREAWRSRTLREFDERVTAVEGGFGSADAYYETASPGPLLGAVRVPTLLIAAEDDPIVPFESYAPYREALAANPALSTRFVPEGGHVGFVSAPWAPRPEPWMDAHWAENQALLYLRERMAGATVKTAELDAPSAPGA